MKLVFAGTPDVALPSLTALAASSHELLACVTRPDAAVGRSRKLVPSPVAAWALEHGVEVLRPKHPKDPEFQARLAQLAPDCVPVVAYGALIPPSALARPRLGWVNLHFSLLPAYRGAAPVQRAIMNREPETGASVFQLVDQLDAGAVFGTCRTSISAATTSGELLAELAESGAQLLVEVLDALAAGTAIAVEQDESGVTFAPKLGVAEAQIDWTAPDSPIVGLVHGCNPAPGAWTTFAGQRFKVLRVAQSSEVIPPGQLLVRKRDTLVGTGGFALALVEVQPFGKKPMSGADWGRGLTGETMGFEHV